MEYAHRMRLIKELAQDKPRYVQDYTDFKPGDPIYYSGPYYDNTELELAMESLLTGKWLVAGPYVERFQAAFSKKFNVVYSHMVNSGSSANLVMLAALKKLYNWKDDYEIIVSPVGFPTTIAPIVQNKMIPVFVDIEMNTLNFDVDKILSKITLKTAAIFVSPVLGNPPDMDRLRQICEDNHILLIGDNCDSLGTKYNGKLINEYYTAWTCSFYPAHHISTGEGGMVCTNDEALHTLIRSFSWWGKACYCVGSANLMPCGTCGKRFDKWLEGYEDVVDHRFTFDNMGYNLKPIDLQGAIGLAQLAKFDEIHSRRSFVKKMIGEMVESILGVRTAKILDLASPSWFGVPIICESKDLKLRLQAHFEDAKIQTRPYFAGNILMHKGYKHLGNYKDYPESNKVLDTVFFLGCPPMYNTKILDYIHQTVQEFKFV